MPRFPVLPQRTSVPAAFSNTPRAQAAHFGAGIGREITDAGSGAVELGRTMELRREWQVKQQLSNFDLELAKQRSQSDAQAPPDEESDGRIARHKSVFETNAETFLKSHEGKVLHGRLSEAVEMRRERVTRSSLEREAHRRLRKSLQDTQALVGEWSERIAQDPSAFSIASRELLGDESGGEAGLLAGLGLRPEALAVWRGNVLKRLLDARIISDPAGLIAELDSGDWHKQLPEVQRTRLLEDAREARQRQDALEAIDLGQRRAATAQQLLADIGAGRAGGADIRGAEEKGTVSAPQAEALWAEAERAEIARQAQQVAGDELALSLSSGVGFDAGNPQNRRAADAFYETAFRDDVRAGADAATQGRIAHAVAKTGYIPKGLAQDLSGKLLGADEAGRIQGAELYGRLRAAAPDVLERAVGLETRARAGLLNHWLELGLAPAEALTRSEAVAPRDAKLTGLEPDETAALKRALRNRVGDGPEAWVADRLLEQLTEKYQSDLAKGLSPRAARTALQKHAASALFRLDGLMAGLAEEGFVLEEQGGRRVLVQTEARLQDAAVITLPLAAAGVLLAGALMMMAVQNAQDMGLDVGEDIEELTYWLNDKSREVVEALYFKFPDLAPLNGWSVVDIPTDKTYLGKIVIDDRDKGVRVVDLQYGAFFRRMSVLQLNDEITGTYVGHTGRYLDWDGKDTLIDLQTGLVIPHEERGRYLSPPLEPHSGQEFNPGGFGEGVEVEQQITTGGEPADNSLLNGQSEGLVPPATIGDQLPGYPDQSDLVNGPQVVFSKPKEEPWPTGYEVDARTFYPDWQGLQHVVPKIPREWGVKHNQKAARPGRRIKPGVRWQDPSYQGNHIRVDKGDPNSELEYQRVDHVVVNYGGTIRGPDGEPIDGPLDKNPEAHIPVTEYVKWKTWYAP